ncbi:MAG: carboxymuconolactone decarboxylase family protein [Mycobacterium sp.]|nr:carboxymuconolactone decarboxylase family protein [Mycobacterium sp.]
MSATAVPWAQRSGFAATDPDGRLIGPFNPSAEQEHTSRDERVHQVVILTVGAVWQAPYELYAHSAVARHAGLSEAVIAQLAGGAEPDELTDAQTAAHRLARQLSTGHRVDDAVYDHAEQIFGAAGVADITVLAGIYHTVCAILTAFAVPAPSQRRAVDRR